MVVLRYRDIGFMKDYPIKDNHLFPLHHLFPLQHSFFSYIDLNFELFSFSVQNFKKILYLLEQI